MPPIVRSRPAFSCVSPTAPVAPVSATSWPADTVSFVAPVSVPCEFTLPVCATIDWSPPDCTVPVPLTFTSRCASSASVAPPASVPVTFTSRAAVSVAAPTTCVLPSNVRSPLPAAPCACASSTPFTRASPMRAPLPACSCRSRPTCRLPVDTMSWPAVIASVSPLASVPPIEASPLAACSVAVPEVCTVPVTPMSCCAPACSVLVPIWPATAMSWPACSVTPFALSSVPSIATSPSA